MLCDGILAGHAMRIAIPRMPITIQRQPAPAHCHPLSQPVTCHTLSPACLPPCLYCLLPSPAWPRQASDELDLLLQDSQPLLEPPEEPDPEPHDAMLHAMRCGSGTSAILNKEGARAKYFTVESQAEPVQSVDAAGNAVGYGLWRWDLSLSQFRYKSPCNEFLSIYMNYRIRKVQVHFYPIKLDTQYTAGRSTKKVATSLEDLASQTFTQFESSQYAADSFATELAGNSLPRVGPVAAVFIPLNKDQGLNAEDLSSYSFADFAKSFNTKIFIPALACLGTWALRS